MKILIQDVNSNEVIVYEVADAHLIDSETMAYHASVAKTHCYNTKPVHFDTD